MAGSSDPQQATETGGVEVAQLGEQTNQTQTGTQADPQQNTSSEAPKSSTESENGADGEKASLEDLPKFWQDEIRNLRRENAAKRTAARDASGENSETQERLAAIEAELQASRAAEAQARAESQKTQILAERGLPTKYTSMLAGENAEEWEQAADSLVELRGARGSTPDPAQVAASNQSNPQSEKEKAANAFFSGLNNQ